MVPFEGAEKKCEVTVRSDVDLRSLPRTFWEAVVAACQAEILSLVRNTHCDAYLLSESSLFVWSHRLLLITCGRTQLVRAIHHLLDTLGPETIESLLFQRKNEYYSHLQHSSFDQDVETLQARIDGDRLLLGSPKSHHIQRFHMDSAVQSRASVRSHELLLYQLGQGATATLTRPGQSAASIRVFLQLERMMPGATVDDFVFEPLGYSLNAIRGAEYLTVHITPDRDGSYVSLETNLDLTAFLALPLEILRPRSFDLVLAHPLDTPALLARVPADYAVAGRQSARLPTGDHLEFIHLAPPLAP